MKHFFTRTIVIAALVLALVLGAMALAENAGTENAEIPTFEETQPEQPATEAQSEQPAQDAATDANAALQDALNAYRSAQQSGRMEDLESELNNYVASGKLTQEQADLVLNYYKEQEALRNGTCPNCGYEFQSGFGKGGFGGKGNRGGQGGFGGQGGRGGKGGMNRQQQQDANGGASASGTAYFDEFQTMPFESGLEGI